MRNKAILKNKSVWDMCKCMVSMATIADSRTLVCLKITLIQVVAHPRLLNLVQN